MSELTLQEIEHYQRHLSLPQFGEEAQLKLKNSRVLVVGAGGLGCPVLQYLAAAGVGTLGVIDFDTVDLSNLQRQILFTEEDVGKSKAEVAAKRLRAMNSCIEVVTIPERLTAQNALALFSDYDLIVDGSDNFTTRYLVNDACVLADKPLIYGAIYTFQGQVSVFNYKGGPTYRCLFPDPPDPKDTPNCSEIGVIGVLPGLIGTLQASEAIKVLTGVGEPLSGALLLLDVLSMKQQTVRFQRVPEAAHVNELKEIEFSCELEPVNEDREEIDVQELKTWMSEGRDFQLLDVREGWERAMAKIDSLHIPMSELLAPGSDLISHGLQQDKLLVIYCASGGRSLMATRELRARGNVSTILSLQGGIGAWVQAGN
ncbi:MAG: molybdopterin-synthase adenylyltransferase MoeB [Opitutales bacterium]|nr:molybdopterin-synthase adenylyltransferase MoeB [Opitutales bacterium]